MKLLVVEDEEDMNRLIAKILKKNGYTVDCAFDGEEALLCLDVAEYDCILLDVSMPVMDGHETIREIRKRNISTPVLFLTARDSVSDRVQGLDMGADDYLVKPFDFDELLARIRVLTRKNIEDISGILTFSDLTLDKKRHMASRGGEDIELLPKEFTILEYLMRNAGVVLSRTRIEDQIWNNEYTGSSNNVDGYMSRLRKKIDKEGLPRLIHTIRGVGWVLKEQGR